MSFATNDQVLVFLRDTFKRVVAIDETPVLVWRTGGFSSD
jgi:hypothetical protein